MPETSAPAHDILQLLLDGQKDIHGLLALRPAQAQSVERRRQLEGLIVELMENPTLDGKELDAAAAALTIGAGLWALGRIEEALAALAKAPGSEADYLAGICHLEEGSYPRAMEALERASRGKMTVQYLATLALAEATAKAGDPNAALAELRPLARPHKDDPELHCLLGLCYDLAGRRDEAIKAYEKAVELDPDHAQATFRIAFNAALRGDEEHAREHYEAIAERGNACYVNALVNLGVLYENDRQFEKAMECFRRVLQVAPRHPRARLFLRDTHASLDMVYDEDRQRDVERQSKLLAIPIADFELTVRARNCLQHMNIYSLGDLVHHTEEELLAWKNFGDTSLHEIREMLTVRGLRLGQTREDLGEEAELEAELAPQAIVPEGPVDEAVLLTSIDELNLSIRSKKCMDRLGIVTIGQLIEHTAEELLASRNFGRTSLVEITERLGKFGLALQEPPPPPEEEAGEGADAADEEAGEAAEAEDGEAEAEDGEADAAAPEGEGGDDSDGAQADAQ